jgi:hypothetical protein
MASASNSLLDVVETTIVGDNDVVVGSVVVALCADGKVGVKEFGIVEVVEDNKNSLISPNDEYLLELFLGLGSILRSDSCSCVKLSLADRPFADHNCNFLCKLILSALPFRSGNEEANVVANDVVDVVLGDWKGDDDEVEIPDNESKCFRSLPASVGRRGEKSWPGTVPTGTL